MSYGANKYGEYKYGEESLSDPDIELHTPDLMSLLPWYYQGNKTMKELQNSAAKELGKLYYNLEDLINQLFIDTATWGLSIYEKELGLPTNLNLSYEERREIIKAKLRGAGTTTKAMIKNVAIAFSGGEVEVLEYPAEYRFVVQFVGVKGIPPNMAGLIQSIEEIKPAHLQYEFKYTYTVWGMVSHLTWGDVSPKTWYELMIYEESEQK